MPLDRRFDRLSNNALGAIYVIGAAALAVVCGIASYALSEVL